MVGGAERMARCVSKGGGSRAGNLSEHVAPVDLAEAVADLDGRRRGDISRALVCDVGPSLLLECSRQTLHLDKPAPRCWFSIFQPFYVQCTIIQWLKYYSNANFLI